MSDDCVFLCCSSSGADRRWLPALFFLHSRGSTHGYVTGTGHAQETPGLWAYFKSTVKKWRIHLLSSGKIIPLLTDCIPVSLSNLTWERNFYMRCKCWSKLPVHSLIYVAKFSHSSTYRQDSVSSSNRDMFWNTLDFCFKGTCIWWCGDFLTAFFLPHCSAPLTWRKAFSWSAPQGQRRASCPRASYLSVPGWPMAQRAVTSQDPKR